jgi:hypothetical protein
MNDGAALLADWGPLTAIDARRQITTLGDDIDFEAPIKRDAEGLGFLKSGVAVPSLASSKFDPIASQEECSMQAIIVQVCCQLFSSRIALSKS